MKTVQTFIIFFATVMLLGTSALGEQTKEEAKTPAVKAPEKETVKELKNQTHCPVMGGKIDSTSYTDIQGQRVYFCCPMCEKDLRKDPDKYFKKAAEESILFENVQTFCPVSGEKLETKNVFEDYEGRRIYFCSEGCVSAFDKAPDEFLGRLDGKPVSDTEKQEMPKADEHHSKQGHN